MSHLYSILTIVTLTTTAIPSAQAEIESALDAGRLALCAEAIGAADVLLEMTVDYLKQRNQFGQVIASFQALQHRIVDMAAEIEQARSITILAAATSLDFHVSLAQLQLLPKLGIGVGGKRIGIELQPHTAQLQILILFRQTSAALDVKQDIPLLHPDVHADVTAATGHRLRGVFARRVPNDIVGIQRIGVLRFSHSGENC